MTTNVTKICAVASLLLLFLMRPAAAVGADNGQMETIKQALDASSLSRTGQAEVNARAAAAINAGVPAEDVQVIVVRALGRNTDTGSINRFLDTGISAKRDGLPVGPVLDRIEQGLSKGVPPERIAAAAGQLVEKLRVAKPFVDALMRSGVSSRQGSERDAAIVSSARALEKSIPAASLEGIGAAVREKHGSLPLYTRAVDTATYFAGNGMSSETASKLVRHALEKGSSERDLDSMVHRMDDEMRHGARVEDAAETMDRDSMQGERGMNRQDMQSDHGGGAGPGMGGKGGRGR